MNYPYLVSPMDAIQIRARQDGTTLMNWYYDWDTEGAAAAVEQFEAAVSGDIVGRWEAAY